MKELDEFYKTLVETITKQVTQNVLSKVDIQPVLDKPLTPEEVAEFLKVDKSTIYKMCKEKQIRSVKIGSIHSRKPHLRILKKDLDEWMNQNLDEGGAYQYFKT